MLGECACLATAAAARTLHRHPRKLKAFIRQVRFRGKDFLHQTSQGKIAPCSSHHPLPVMNAPDTCSTTQHRFARSADACVGGGTVLPGQAGWEGRGAWMHELASTQQHDHSTTNELVLQLIELLLIPIQDRSRVGKDVEVGRKERLRSLGHFITDEHRENLCAHTRIELSVAKEAGCSN